jgi:hypothetical protein
VHIDLPHLILVVRIGSAMFASTVFLGHWCWWWHLLMIQKSFALFQIVSSSMMDLAPFLFIGRAMEQSLLLLVRGLLLTISAISVISTISCIDLSIVLLLL